MEVREKKTDDFQAFASGESMQNQTELEKLSQRVEQLKLENKKLESKNSKLEKKARKLKRSDKKNCEKKLLQSLDEVVLEIFPSLRKTYEELKASGSNSPDNSGES